MPDAGGALLGSLSCLVDLLNWVGAGGVLSGSSDCVGGEVDTSVEVGGLGEARPNRLYINMSREI